MTPLVQIIVLSCLATAPMDDFNPHMIGAAQAYMRQHPGVCHVAEPVIIERGVTSEECQSQAMLHVLPDWQKQHPNDIWVGAICEEHKALRLNLPQNAER